MQQILAKRPDYGSTTIGLLQQLQNSGSYTLKKGGQQRAYQFLQTKQRADVSKLEEQLKEVREQQLEQTDHRLNKDQVAAQPKFNLSENQIRIKKIQDVHRHSSSLQRQLEILSQSYLYGRWGFK